jgi:rubrerythrin
VSAHLNRHGVPKSQFTKAQAKRALKQTTNSTDRFGVRSRMQVYRCPVCDYWHLGHAPREGAA